MRNLFVLLLLVNLVVAMWWLWIEPGRAPAPAADTAGPPTSRLVLVSELDVMLQSATPAGEVTGLALAVPASPDPSPVPGGAGAMATADAADAAEGQPSADATDAPQPPDESASAAVGDVGGSAQADPAAPTMPSSPAADDSPAVTDVPEPTAAAPVSSPSIGNPANAVADPARIAPVAVADATPGAESPAAGPRCVSLGPFLNLREATVAASRLRTEGLEPRQRLARSQVWMGYWVHLPAFESRAAAVAAVDRLREQGIDDIYIEPAGPLRNTVSLGVFSDEARAESHAATIRGLDVVVPAQVVERYRDDEVYWLDFELAAERPLDPQVYAPSSQTLRLEDPGCG